MHPVTMLFEEIYRDHWGIPPRERRSAQRAEAPSWLRNRPARRGGSPR